jgi:sialic acid synthase SpsE
LLDGWGEKEHKTLKEICDAHNIEFMSTPFDNDAVEYLDKIGTRIFKIASCDITNFPLIEHIAKTGKIVMLSTGAAEMEEIEEAVKLIDKYTNKIVVMHCNLNYPTASEDINLDMLADLNYVFGDLVLGLSDHTISTLTPALAYMLNANVIEKHFTVDKTLEKSADHWMSADVDDMKEIVKNVKLAQKMKGKHNKGCTESELITRKYARRSIVASVDIKKDEIFTGKNLACKRPGTGLSPKLWNDIIGRTATKDFKADDLITY